MAKEPQREFRSLVDLRSLITGQQLQSPPQKVKKEVVEEQEESPRLSFAARKQPKQKGGATPTLQTLEQAIEGLTKLGIRFGLTTLGEIENHPIRRLHFGATVFLERVERLGDVSNVSLHTFTCLTEPADWALEVTLLEGELVEG